MAKAAATFDMTSKGRNTTLLPSQILVNASDEYEQDQISPIVEDDDEGTSSGTNSPSTSNDDWLIDESYNRILEQLNMVNMISSIPKKSSNSDNFIAAGSYTLKKWRKDMKFPVDVAKEGHSNNGIEDDDSGVQMSNDELEFDQELGATSEGEHSTDSGSDKSLNTPEKDFTSPPVKFTLRDKTKKSSPPPSTTYATSSSPLQPAKLLSAAMSLPNEDKINRLSTISIAPEHSQLACFCSPVLPHWFFNRKSKKKKQHHKSKKDLLQEEEAYGFNTLTKTEKRRSILPQDLPTGSDETKLARQSRKANILSRKDASFSPKWKNDYEDEATIVKLHQNGTNNSLPSQTRVFETRQNESNNVPDPKSPILNKSNGNSQTTYAGPEVSLTIAPPQKSQLPPAAPYHHPIVNSPHTPSTLPSYAGKFATLPRFFYPNGKPISKGENESALRKVALLFSNLPHGLAEYNDVGEVCKTVGLPIYWKRPVYDACMKIAGRSSSIPVDGKGALKYQEFASYWNNMTSNCHDEASRFVYTLAVGNCVNDIFNPHSIRNHVIKSDFVAMLMDLIETYPGLDFLRAAPNFHMRYIDVVTVRIFWTVNRSWSGKITALELRKSNFLETVKSLDVITDINKITDYFSYEHFYVTYCKFWEIDEDHDLLISQTDMQRHGDGAIPRRIIERIFSSAVNKDLGKIYGSRKFSSQTIGFSEFVAFLLAEEDKRNPTSIEYWFRVMDLDGDGVISLAEMEYFHEEVMQMLAVRNNMEPNSMKDVICNTLDMISPQTPNRITLRDIKKSGLSHRFYNTFVNELKFFDQETNESERVSIRTDGDREMSDWDAFCAFEYESLMAENLDEGQEEDGSFDENIDINLYEDE
uniref:EF-hand domain-containing protein n=1 Tax=Rhabditophanes sp. KR3021 TaxID=114890 RepID=A0AC35TQU2_9BILA